MRWVTLGTLLFGVASGTSAEAQAWDSSEPFGSEDFWSNYVVLVDLDGDDDLDAIFANATGFLTTPTAQALRRYRNDGALARADLRSGGPSIAARQVTVGDVDGDGDLDVYVPDARGGSAGLLLRNDGGDLFEDISAGLPDVAPNAGFARFADVDSDGDLDLFVGQGYADPAARPLGLLLTNDGTGSFTDASDQLPSETSTVDAVDIDVLDADGDFDLDAIVNLAQGAPKLWTNDGTGRFSSSDLPGGGAVFHYGPAVCDVDGDGDLDVWVDNQGPASTEQLLINDGMGDFSDETASRVTGNPAGDDTGLACVDVDDDGDFDLVIAALRPSGERMLVNDGDGNFSERVSAFFPDADTSLWIAAGDMSGDGRVDFVTAQGETGDSVNRFYLGDSTVPVDGTAPLIRDAQRIPTEASADETLVLRFAVSDRETSDVGPHLREAYVELVGESEVPAVFSGGDVFRATVNLAGRAGDTVSLRYCATDLRGATTCSDTTSVDVVDGPVESDAAVDAGDVDGGSRDSGPRRDGGALRDAAPRDAAGVIDTGFPGVPEEDDGCGCRTAGGGATLPLFFLLLFARRRVARRSG